MKMRTKLVLVIFLILFYTSQPVAAEEFQGNVTVLVAASLTDLFNKTKNEFEQKYPKAKILIEPGGSLTLIRKITDLSRAADVIVVADRSLIPSYLIPKHADQSIDFLTERMAIVMAEKARYADSITAQNWMDILLMPDVEFGVSDPEVAPVGYRALMVWKLAEQYYKKPGLYQKLTDKLQKKNVRPNATALLTLLKLGELDYIFDYPSLARQHGLRVVDLPPQIDMGDPNLADVYKAVSVDVPGPDPGSKKTIQGAPIVYSLALLKNAPNPKTAQGFIDFVLGPNGQAIMARLGMTPLKLAAQ